ncbi:MAG: hypothetical protein C0597_10470 [Marinilabiliales bacterium]|nr:MAG: hypothetical protein C0597_10470 [Marinilabiliales bacterium]
MQTKSVSGNWQELGPAYSNGGYAGVGRVNCISFHPSDTNTYWVGTPSGGLWRTTDDGQSWNVLTDGNDVLGVSDIAVPSDFESSNTLYIATGDRDGGSVWSLGGGQYYDNHTIGVLKSTDGGSTWVETGLNYTVDDTWIIGRLLIDTTDNQTLFASTYTGIYKTIDGGSNWTKELTSDYVIDMEFKPGDPTTIYASTKYSNSSKIYRSTDGGDNWSEMINFGSGSRRTEIAVTEDDPNYIYAIVSNTSGGLKGIYKSRDGGDNFEQTFAGDEVNHYLLNYYSDGSGDANTGQGNYDLAIVVAPNDTNTVYIGGVNTWKSEDGGYTWNINNMWTSYNGYNFVGAPVVHADKHVLRYRDTLALFEGNDGGIYKTNNEGVNWTDLTDGMVISQIYRLSVSQNSESLVIAGLQDNGTKLLYTDGNWYDIKGGDGMECIIDPTDDNVQYGTYTYGEIERTLDGWSTSNTSIISDNIADADGGAWVSPYILDPNNSQTIYVGYNDVWKSTDRGDNFTQISTINTGNDLRSMVMSPANSSVMYVADPYDIWKTDNGGTSWSNITGTLPNAYSITHIQAKHTSSDTLWVAYGGYDAQRVFESTDGGATWSNISAGLPNLPVFSIIQNRQVEDSLSLYAATDIGVFVKNGDNDWIMFSDGLPNVMVTDLDIFYDDILPENSRLRAATYGRGLWESDLYDEPKITIDNIEQKFYISETVTDNIDITFQIFATFSSNTFTAYLSDEQGYFDSETSIGALESDNEGTINATIPANIPSGTKYRVRVKSSNPVYVSSASNEFEINLDDVNPTVNLSSIESGTTTASIFDMNIVFSEKVYGFEQTDISITNASITDFDDTSSPNYVVEISPSASGIITVNIPENVATDSIGNPNMAAAQWTITYTPTNIELLKEYGISIYPNPSDGKFRVDIAKSNATQISVIDISGRVIYSENLLRKYSSEIDLSRFSKGVYVLKMKVDNQEITSKVIIQ